jgi:putative sugar O-methyltransferase
MRSFSIFTILSFFLFAFINKQPISFSDNQVFPSHCLTLAQDEQRFKNFKRDAFFTLFFENATKEEGQTYLTHIADHFPDLFKRLEMCRKNDEVGDPLTYEYSQVGRFSPSTLRYVKIAGDISNYFGDMKDARVLEIGAGYGGLCTILTSLFSIQSYSLSDLPEPLELCTRYLKSQNISNISGCALPKLPTEEYDLIISDCFFSELDRSVQLEMIEKVFPHSKAGLLICTPAHWKEIPITKTEFARVKPLSEEKLLDALKKQGMRALVISEGNHTWIYWEKI